MTMQNSKSKNDLVPWAFWKLARVEELLNGRDGFVRAAIVSVRVGQVVIPINVWEDLFNISFQLKYSREVYQVWTFQRLIFFSM